MDAVVRILLAIFHNYFIMNDAICSNMDATLRVFERRFAVYLLVLIYRNPDQPKSYYIYYDPKFSRTKHERLEELEAAGFIESYFSDDNKKNKLLRLTKAGDIVAKAMVSVYPMIGGTNDVDPDTY